MKLTKKTIVSLCLVLAICLGIFAAYTCVNRNISFAVITEYDLYASSATNLMLNITRDDISPIEIVEDEQNKTDEIMSFSFDILENSNLEENILISPLSIISALGMTANAANGDTLNQMQEVFGSDIQSLNDYLYSYMTNLPNGETYKINLANSIWLKENEVECSEEFLQTVKNYYEASLYEASFDASTIKDINNWVNDETDGMINDVISEIDDTTIMYLINALSFDAQWNSMYDENQVIDGEFTTETGIVQDVEFMCSDEYKLIELENAIGFVKDYDESKYSFVALLPDENLSMQEFIESLDSNEVLAQLSEDNYQNIEVKIPKFSFDYSTELSDVLVNLGMSDAFNSVNANFSELSLLSDENDNIFISQVIHKTTITVGEQGTQAGAVTAVILDAATATAPPEEIYEIYLDRPFLFMIVDNELNLPIFMGSLMEV